MTDSRDFHLGDVLSVTHGSLVSPRHIAGVADLLQFMTGETLFTHQLPRAADACKQHPALNGVYLPDWSKDVPGWQDMTSDEKGDVIQKWLIGCSRSLDGIMLEVTSLPEGAYTYVPPITEFVNLRREPDGT